LVEHRVDGIERDAGVGMNGPEMLGHQIPIRLFGGCELDKRLQKPSGATKIHGATDRRRDTDSLVIPTIMGTARGDRRERLVSTLAHDAARKVLRRSTGRSTPRNDGPRANAWNRLLASRNGVFGPALPSPPLRPSADVGARDATASDVNREHDGERRASSTAAVVLLDRGDVRGGPGDQSVHSMGRFPTSDRRIARSCCDYEN
jgi:hypothetical protein